MVKKLFKAFVFLFVVGIIVTAVRYHGQIENYIQSEVAEEGGELTRQKAKGLLERALSNKLRKECRLYEELAQKPEFSAIKDEVFCTKHVVVEGIQRLSPVEALVEWHISTEANLPALEKWLAAMGKLQERLKTISRMAYCAAEGLTKRVCALTGYKFIDTTDKQEFKYHNAWAGNYPLKARQNNLVNLAITTIMASW
jgi:hypothetical protein